MGKCSGILLLLLLLLSSSLQYYIIIINVFGCDIINIGRRRPHLVHINSRLSRSPMNSVAHTHTHTHTHSSLIYTYIYIYSMYV